MRRQFFKRYHLRTGSICGFTTQALLPLVSGRFGILATSQKIPSGDPARVYTLFGAYDVNW